MTYNNIYMSLLCLFVVILGWPAVTIAEDDDSKCSHDAVVMAMTTCQGERQKLSYASQSNDTSRLCKALQDYSDCMRPRINGCEGPAKTAFDVIISKYASEPYNCKTELNMELNKVEYKSNQASPDREYLENLKKGKDTTKTDGVDNSLKDNGARGVGDDGAAIGDDDEIDEGEDAANDDAKPQNEQPYAIHTPEPSTTDETTTAKAETASKSTAGTDMTTKKAPDNKGFDDSENGVPRLAMTIRPNFVYFSLFWFLVTHLRQFLFI